MEVDKLIIRELLDYTWKLEEQMREELLLNFMELSKHHSEIAKIRDKLIDLEVSMNKDVSLVEDES